jgi:hypothetical protein
MSITFATLLPGGDVHLSSRSAPQRHVQFGCNPWIRRAVRYHRLDLNSELRKSINGYAAASDFHPSVGNRHADADPMSA